MSERSNVEFAAEDGVTLRGWFYTPRHAEISNKRAAISMSHGFAATKGHGLHPIASAFADDGFYVLVHDHRGFGKSDGSIRHDVDPWRQIADWRCAISFLESQPGVDGNRLGIWGTSFSGGHAFILGATDRRIRCVVSQVPIVSGFEQGRRRVAPDATAALEQTFIADDRRVFVGEPRQRISIVSTDPAIAAAYRTKEAEDFYTQHDPDAIWLNEVTLRSTREARMYEPASWIPRISPTPLLMIVGLRDTVTMGDLALASYQQALPPKRLVTLNCGHFEPYKEKRDDAVQAALNWFNEWLP